MEEKLLQIIQRYGINHQLRKFNEEAFELEEAIIKAECNRLIGISRNPSELAIDHIAEELADVMVLLSQFKEYYDIKPFEIYRVMEQKIDRQLNRIKGEQNEK